MLFATIIAVLYLLILGGFSLATSSPFVFVIGLLLFPNVMQSIPFGLDAMDRDNDDDDDKSNPIGFTADID